MRMASLTQPGELPGIAGQLDDLLNINQTTAGIDHDLAQFQASKRADSKPVAQTNSSMRASTELPKIASEPVQPRPAILPPSLMSRASDILDGLVSSVPIGLAGVALAYASLPAQYLGMGVLATLMSLALVHIASSATARPMAFSARLFEATTLAAMLASFAKLMPGWGLAATPEQLLALLCIMCGLAGVVSALLFVLRADRFTRLIPAPVYSGFAISISILLLVSQSQTLYRLWKQGSPWMILLSISVITIAVALLVRKYRPRWPSTAISIAAGALVGLGWAASGSTVAMIMPAGQALMLPWQVADFSSLLGAGVNRTALATSVAYNSILLGIMIFINTTVANETISQLDDRYASRWQMAGVALATALGGSAGSAPVASSTQAAMAAVRNSPMSGFKAIWIGLLCLAVAALGLLNWVALAAVAAAMLVDGYFMADRLAIKQGWAWVRGAKLQTSQKEDLVLVAIVTFTAVVFNVVSAVFIGLLFGLILFAMRNAKQPVRFVWTGAQLHSNCARGRGEIAILAGHGERIRVVELEGELFFGSVASLDASLLQSLAGAHTVILDWSRVRHIDSSIALSLSRWQRLAAGDGVQILQAGAGLQAGNVPNFVAQYLPKVALYPDLDRALEAAESAVIASFGVPGSLQTTQLKDALQVFKGLSDAQREQLESCMQQRLFRQGDIVFQAGDPSDHMLIVLQGNAAVIVKSPQGLETRLTSVRRGGVLGEIGFLDQAPRSAQVVAQEDLLVAIFTRQAFEELRLQEPQIVLQLITNLTLDLSTRLRHTNKLASARGATQ
jgi:sulfate permease, SulP family